MTAPGAGWKVTRRGGVCSACEREFAVATDVVSALYDEGDSFSRRDWCRPCFDGPDRGRDPFSWWATEVPEPQELKAAFDLGVAREFLVRLLREDAPERESLRYLLALMLMRKRGVKLVEQYTDSRGEVMTFTVPPHEEEHEVVCADIDEEEADGLRAELDRLFDL